MSGDPIENGCRLVVHQSGSWPAELAGAPADLQALADLLDSSNEVVAAHLTGTRPGDLRRRLTPDSRLRISVDPGPILCIEGTARAVSTLSHAMRGVAGQALEQGFGTVARHAHIEYLGDDDEWRAPDTVPLIVTSDWPERGFVVASAMSGRRFAVRLLPDDVTSTADRWDDIQDACAEHDVPWKNVVVHHSVRDRLLQAWGERPSS